MRARGKRAGVSADAAAAASQSAGRSVLRGVMIALCVLGLALTAYLTVVHYSGGVPFCTTKHNTCEQVQTSIYSHVLGIPVALLGLIGYVGIFVLLLAPDRDLTRVGVLGVTLFGLVFSGYLTYREVFTLKEICEECVTSAVLMALLFIGAVVRYLAGAPLLGSSASLGDS